MRLAACAIALLAAGCATLPEAGDAGDWPERRQALQALERWQLDGRVAVAAGSDGFSGSLRWRQSGERSEIELRGPLGSGTIAIRVDGNELSVADERGQTLDGAEARDYILRSIGGDVPLPITEMRYWLVGVPAPGAAYQESIGADQRLARLEQQDWRVAYSTYRGVGGVVLPSRVEMTTEGLRLRLVVADWRLGP